jgi:hypothetical protein
MLAGQLELSSPCIKTSWIGAFGERRQRLSSKVAEHFQTLLMQSWL